MIKYASGNFIHDPNNSRVIEYNITVNSDPAVCMPYCEAAGALQSHAATLVTETTIPPGLWSNTDFPAVKNFDVPGRAAANGPFTTPVVTSDSQSFLSFSKI